MPQEPIQFQAHPPERKQRSGVVLHAGCCCCCCLHSAGSLFGAIFGSTRSNPPQRPRTLTPPPEALERFRPSARPATSERVTESREEAFAPPEPGLTEEAANRGAEPPEQPRIAESAETPLLLPERDWSASQDQAISGPVLYWLTVLILTLLACIWAAFQFRGNAAKGLAMVLLGFLPGVLLAAAAVAALLVFLYPPEERPPRWRAIGLIALWTFAGTLVGILLMSCCFLPIFR